MLVQYLLPVDHPQRVTVGCVAAVIAILLILKLASTLPPLGTGVPLICK